MRRFTRLFLVTCLMLLCSQTSWADFKNFSVQVNNQAGTLLTAAEQTQGTQFSFGVAVAADGTVSRVETTDASSVATVSGKFHSDHGATELSVVVPVDGNVKITVGQCTFSGSDIKVTDASGQVVASKSPGKNCWKNSHDNITELNYTGGATTLTISGMGYCPYVAVEKSTAVIQKFNVTFTNNDSETVGKAPEAVAFTEGDAPITIPANKTLYKEGLPLQHGLTAQASMLLALVSPLRLTSLSHLALRRTRRHWQIAPNQSPSFGISSVRTALHCLQRRALARLVLTSHKLSLMVKASM